MPVGHLRHGAAVAVPQREDRPEVLISGVGNENKGMNLDVAQELLNRSREFVLPEREKKILGVGGRGY